MMRTLKIYLSVVCTLLLLSGCQEDADPILPHTEFILPDAEGLTKITQIIDTTYNTAGPLVEKYFKQEIQRGTEKDLTGRDIRLIDVYRSEDIYGTDFQWELNRVWSQYIEERSDSYYFAERTEENKRIQILKFPVYPGIQWDGNRYNSDQSQIYTYTHLDTMVTVQGHIYDHCVVVLREETRTSISDILDYEIYAPNVGLIKKYNRTKIFNGSNFEFNPDLSRVYVEEIVVHD
ncbi:hypothetical protein [Pontibacter sp. G13]|uniref:hypothetical protein n=1 Tax=Pontibacter sp. G13 TaxID=3074898 RepID=UPI002889E73D|nr:hypothetical protein [Pontibacter sp. G13]WNJ19573.1 hypothetical protein RJD25_03710 [Pontibacter sp. G13]